jgi:phosphohistidine phosphatase
MQLLLLRHGLAEADSTSGRDCDRALSDEGRQKLALMLPGLLRLGLAADGFWTSPWRRAIETAHALRPLSRGAPSLYQGLAEAPNNALLQALGDFQLSCSGTLALVGHQPWLGELYRWLVTGKRGAAQELALPKGGLLWLSGDPEPGAMRLELFARPARLIALGQLP